MLQDCLPVKFKDPMFMKLSFHKDKYNFIYVLVHRNILMYYIIYTCIPFIYVDMHINTILAVCLVFSIL